jgi:hypothetical protein
VLVGEFVGVEVLVGVVLGVAVGVLVIVLVGVGSIPQLGVIVQPDEDPDTRTAANLPKGMLFTVKVLLPWATEPPPVTTISCRAPSTIET